MTINEMIKALEEMANNGCGDYEVVNADCDEISGLFVEGLDMNGNKALVIYF